MLPTSYTVRRSSSRKPAGFPWPQFGWYTFYAAALQWILVLLLCLFQQGAVVTAYYTPVLAVLRMVTPGAWLLEPTMQLGMVWMIFCLMTYGMLFALVILQITKKRG